MDVLLLLLLAATSYAAATTGGEHAHALLRGTPLWRECHVRSLLWLEEFCSVLLFLALWLVDGAPLMGFCSLV